jgi:2-C-methyl-D-erythritol 4-phosphate cytidylyltransferase
VLTAVIAAAGSGERLGAGGPKAFVEVAGKPLLEWSLEAFKASQSTGDIIVATPAGKEGEVEAMGAIAVTGGNARADSVAAALELVETEVVAIHDAARPLVTEELIDALALALDGAADADGVIAAAPVTDTVKEAGEEGRIERTLDRALLWGAQTPQVFRTAALRQALAAHGGPGATDEAMVIEAAGGTVLLHDPGVPNFKVTLPSDIALAEALLDLGR